jgi:hypothetical protein
MLIASLIPAAFAATIVTCFAPEQDCAALAIGAIDSAGREVLVNAYAFTTGSGIPTALVRAHARGVDAWAVLCGALGGARRGHSVERPDGRTLQPVHGGNPSP